MVCAQLGAQSWQVFFLEALTRGHPVAEPRCRVARVRKLALVPSLLGSVIAQELAGPSPGHLHSVWRSSVADTLVWGAHEVRSGQPSRFSPLGFQHSLFPRHGLARGAHAGSAQCMAMLEPWPTVSFLRGSLVLVAGAGCRTASAASALRERSVWYNCGMCRYVGGG